VIAAAAARYHEVRFRKYINLERARSWRGEFGKVTSIRPPLGIGRKVAMRLTERIERGLPAAASRLSRFRALRGWQRTLWGTTPILTLPLLAKCDRLLGLRAQSLVFGTYYITSAFDINLLWVDKFTLSPRIRAKYLWAYAAARKLIFFWALLRYDVFHYFCDRGIMESPYRIGISPVELSLLKRMGKRLYTYTYGADVRTRETVLALGGHNICKTCPEPMKFCICSDEAGRVNMENIRQVATQMIATGDMRMHVQGYRDLFYWPIDVDAKRFAFVGVGARGDRPLRVAHAPNHPQFKGTQYIFDALERLQREGRAIELVKIQGVSNEEVLKLFRSCDLIVDQLIQGSYGYTALEAMALGKPVIACLREPAMVIDPRTCPIINAWPETIYERLKDVLDGEYDLAMLGREGRAYVSRYHSLQAVALRLGELYLDTARFPDKVNRKIRTRMAELESGLPPRPTSRPPVPWPTNAARTEAPPLATAPPPGS
jgi:glycosyltransferase involved in cell wall biosynthesis